MSGTTEDFSKMGVMRAFVLPALWIFLVPVVSLLFFIHARGQFDDDFREAALQQIRTDAELTEEEKEAAIAFYSAVPFSRMLLDEEFAAQVDDETLFHYATFRWAIRLSAWSIVLGISVFLFAGVCVLFSLRSQRAQAVSLAVGWHVLRLFSAAQVIIQGALLVALSFWVTALWFNFYSVRLIGVAAIVALLAVAAIIKAIFTTPNVDFSIEGDVVPDSEDMTLWDELRSLCESVGTEPPDQVVAGIDDNFFVTEHPVIVGETTCHGRTLFVSLSLLKQLDGEEAKAVLAHEMAHFSGNDTVYSRKISPLLNRYNHYLAALHDGGITLPIFSFMHCFRVLFELSLGKHSRQREFRADRIAVEQTSPRDLASALLRIAAYSRYRGKVEQEIFKQEFVLESADVQDQIEQGFHAYEQEFLSSPDLGELETTHPFDSHPPLSQRLEAVGVSLQEGEVEPLLAAAGDGRWFAFIAEAEAREHKQWSVFEDRFREFHEQSLAYRFLPETDEEREIVERAFPNVSFDSKKGRIEMDYQSVRCAQWDDAVLWSEITGCTLDEGVLKIAGERPESFKREIRLNWFSTPEQRQEMLNAIEAYYTRYLSASQYQEHKQQETDEQQDGGDQEPGS